ncbi:GDP-mannose 4,6-dehydratase [Patescibacteria group bacterium]|nr:GDP-mannose 4,6-dehydratase [Patescibacteria group bacterium]
MQTVIIFGANSQDGYYLADLYRKRGYEVLEISRTGDCLRGDVASFELVEELVRSRKPDVIFHLAATSTTRHEALFENHKTIGTGTLNILEAVYRRHPGCKVFLTGSGVQFVNRGEPIHETDPFDAGSAYSVERIHSVYAARYFRTLGVRVYVGYLFHHESPLRKPNHVSQKIVQAVRRIALGSDEMLELGDISVEKEWAFAGDIAEGIAVLVGQERVFEAVIGTGKTHTIEEWLNICFTSIGKEWINHVVLRDGFTAEYKRLFSNPETMHSLGWWPKIDFAELAELML